MFKLYLQRIVARLPYKFQTELKRIYYARQIKNGTFITTEPEYKVLHRFISPGDLVLDIGANVGHYAKRFSELVGQRGRVIAFEPVPTTFYLLTANVQLFPYSNVTLLNTAVSDKLDIVAMSIPNSNTGAKDYYMAHIDETSESELSVLTLSLDQMFESQRVSLIKIDAESHEPFIMMGMQKLIENHRPVLIIETKSDEITDELISNGYDTLKFENSPNIIFKPAD